ncbi:MAG: hypothetical protein MJ157_01650, partial [Clostridia bacterium]|nr:hypothetical protein [Clostridia bacterium]
PVSLSQVLPRKGSKKKKRPSFNVESLQKDARFINWKSGLWGLTEWTAKADKLSLKQLLIKFLKKHPGGLSLSQIQEQLPVERNYHLRTVSLLLDKFPYFSASPAGIWHYQQSAHFDYEKTVAKYLEVLRKQNHRQQQEKAQLLHKQQFLRQQLNQLQNEYQQTAEELNQKLAEQLQKETISQQAQVEENLQHRQEIADYRRQLALMEHKAQSILHQCRLWVSKSRKQEANYQQNLKQLAQNQINLTALQEKLKQQDGEHQKQIGEWQQKVKKQQEHLQGLKLSQATEVSNLKEQITKLKERLTQTLDAAWADQETYKQELVELREELQIIRRQKVKACLELAEERTTRKALEADLERPLVRLSRKLSAFWNRPPKYQKLKMLDHS